MTFIKLIPLAFLSTLLSVPSFAQNCLEGFEFLSDVNKRTQRIQLNESVTMDIEQGVSILEGKFSKIASNVICQRLTGLSYTGSPKEWQKFFDNAIKGMLAQKMTDIELTVVQGDEKAYKGSLEHKEYVFIADIEGNRQHIYNLAFLNKAKDEITTVSVSGNEKDAMRIYAEFNRLVGLL